MRPLWGPVAASGAVMRKITDDAEVMAILKRCEGQPIEVFAAAMQCTPSAARNRCRAAGIRYQLTRVDNAGIEEVKRKILELDGKATNREMAIACGLTYNAALKWIRALGVTPKPHVRGEPSPQKAKPVVAAPRLSVQEPESRVRRFGRYASVFRYAQGVSA
jgi:hypothetical protein